MAGRTPRTIPKSFRLLLGRVANVEVLAGFTLLVVFADGLRGEVDLTRFVQSSEAGIFAVLADSKVFARVSLDHEAVTWPGELHLAPDAMYEAIQKDGKWIL